MSRKLRKLAPLTEAQQCTLKRELAWLDMVAPTGYGTRAKLMAMDLATDPFNLSQDMRLNRARWFTQLWNTFEFPRGVHLRRIHYVLVSQDIPVPMPEQTAKSVAMAENMAKRLGSLGNGRLEIYVNNKDCWNKLCEAGRDARLLNLVPPGAFVDMRNDDPREFLFNGLMPKATEHDGDLFDECRADGLYPPGWVVEDESAPQLAQPCHVEIWAEKTTMDDVLQPLCEEHGINLITGAGHASLTMVDNFIGRVERRGSPTRILYIADADKSGKDMPPATARKIEFRVRQVERDHGVRPDVQLRRIVLTGEQIAEYDLPPSPIDGRSVELDALEALHPGVLGEIVEGEISRYLDPNFDEKVEEAFDGLKDAVESANDALVTEAEEEELDDLKRQRDVLAAEFNASLDPINARAQALFAGILERRDEPPGFEMAEVEIAGPEDPDPLYDSARTYEKQLARFKVEKERNEG